VLGHDGAQLRHRGVQRTLTHRTQAFAFISVVSVDPGQLIFLIIAMMAGGWLGAGTVSRLPRRVIQLGMATALLLAELFMTMGPAAPLSGRWRRSQSHAFESRRCAGCAASPLWVYASRGARLTLAFETVHLG
jgi:hypothetical protein